LFAYPSALLLLAHERTAGKLKLHPILALTSGEWLDLASRAQIEAAFNCPVRDIYGASEFISMAFDCRQGWLHLNTDWVILEPVDEHYQPVPPGQASRTVLLTNLANRIQPLIRYDLGDSITVNPDPCPCGNPLPAIRVEGRRDDILAFQTPGGETVQVLPLALATVIEETPGVHRFQVIQTAPASLSVRLEVTPGADEALVWVKGAGRLRDYLATQRLPFVRVQRAAEPPRRDVVSGKFRQVWSVHDPA
jgi:phenylacetate-coenzyme A ligase PaaK-like adenylate-forming protein